MPKVTINDVPVEVPDGTPIIAAADQAGVFIPRFCYHPDLRPAGNCRICQVEIEGSPRLSISCMTPVRDGMVARSDTERVKKAVRGDLEFLLVNHPVDCPICDQAGECYLQDFYMQVGRYDSRIPLQDKVRKRKVVDLGNVMLDSERCVMCSRCIRFSDEVTKTSQMGFFHRGTRMEIGTFRDRPIEDGYSVCYADVCPVGALTSKDFRFQSRVWFLERTDSACIECSTGCNVHLDHKDQRIYRYVPRRNPEVNRSWMCDIGRMSYRSVNEDRLLAPLGRASGAPAEITWERAIADVAAVLRDAVATGGPGSVAAIATPRASCEELWLFRRLMREAVGTPHLDFRVDPSWQHVDELEDGLLRRRDHHPNTRGALALGIVPEPDGDGVARILERAARGEVKVLYLLGPELLRTWPDPAAVQAAIRGASFRVLHDTHARSAHADFDVVLPVASFAEHDGTYVNHAGRVQLLRRAFPPPGRALPASDVLAAVAAALGAPEPPRAPRELFREIAARVPAFGGLSHERVGPLGAPLAAAGASGGERSRDAGGGPPA